MYAYMFVYVCMYVCVYSTCVHVNLTFVSARKVIVGRVTLDYRLIVSNENLYRRTAIQIYICVWHKALLAQATYLADISSWFLILISFVENPSQ